MNAVCLICRRPFRKLGHTKMCSPQCRRERTRALGRKWWASLTTEQRERKNARPPEQRERQNANRRERTPEQRERLNAYRREWSANRTPEQRKRANAYMREWLSNLTPEQRLYRSSRMAAVSRRRARLRRLQALNEAISQLKNSNQRNDHANARQIP